MVNLALVVPCYNEEEVLPDSFGKLKKLFFDLQAREIISKESNIYLVDDGSSDSTWAIIEKYCIAEEIVKGVKLSKNSGHQNALLAGLSVAEGEVVISLDADLQDDISVIEQMIQNYCSGDDIVYGVRKKRNNDSFFKKYTALLFYKIMKMLGVDLVQNHADFRLMSRRALTCLDCFKERNIFLRGIVSLIGFKSSCVYYDRKERLEGVSKYPLYKMLSFAWDGITSFSVLPLRFIAFVGFALAVCSIWIVFWTLWVKYFQQNAIPGWASTLLPLTFFSGIQLLSLGMIGEYIGKIYTEVKVRPRYFIEKKL